jgi:hypothetical protein
MYGYEYTYTFDPIGKVWNLPKLLYQFAVLGKAWPRTGACGAHGSAPVDTNPVLEKLGGNDQV